MKKSHVLIYRDIMFPHSETFILAQGEGMVHFATSYVGSRSDPGLEVPAGRACFVNRGRFGRLREILFKTAGWLPRSVVGSCRRLKPQLLHAHFGPDGVQAQILAKALGVPLIVTFHGYDATTSDFFARRSFFLHRRYLRKRHELFDGCARLIAVSQYINGKLLEQGAMAEKVVVHYVGIDLEIFKPAPEVSRSPVVLFVGRLVEVKGCSYLIRAMQRVEATCPGAELVIIGDGPLREQLEQEAQSRLKSYRFLGTQPSAVVREWMNRSKVFCVPSVTAESGAAEAFGIVFAEAQAMGLPVVSCRSGGIPEAVSDGETGFLVPEKDWEGLAERISVLLQDEALWQRFGQAAQQRVREKFDLRQQNRVLEQIYLDVMKR